jgi:hypothetical protein
MNYRFWLLAEFRDAAPSMGLVRAETAVKDALEDMAECLSVSVGAHVTVRLPNEEDFAESQR